MTLDRRRVSKLLGGEQEGETLLVEMEVEDGAHTYLLEATKEELYDMAKFVEGISRGNAGRRVV